MAQLGRRAFLGSALAVGLGAAFAIRSPGRARATGAGTGGGATSQPAILSCAQWGARQPAGRIAVLAHRPDKIIIHHTATGNSADVSRAHAIAVARGIQRLHMDTNGWEDSGQHFTVTRGGFVLEGRHGSLAHLLGGRTMVEGAHCVGQNDRSIGIENEGTYLAVQPPEDLWRHLVWLSALICRRYRVPASEIYGHDDFNATRCPGLLHDRLPDLRRAVAAALS